MATPYSVIDNSFLNKITDDLILTMTDEEIQDMIDSYRTSAGAKFKQCNKLSDRDDDLRQYNQTLTDEEIEILANLMVLEWLKPRINSIEVLKPSMSTKDYRTFSNAKHLDSLLKLKKETLAEIDSLIVSYTYSENSLNDLRKV
ncbi:hypothetical protein [Schnuerera sp.]|uniref:hypothetical protein n=1 Tax=Schnuerera sp. TaxID=2794844 RepID=UPI002BE117A9|nr:hypothetical protein [Schnuerera sp.]HSH35656.1 hypothetical protein [Schnuerera sp.]